MQIIVTQYVFGNPVTNVFDSEETVANLIQIFLENRVPFTIEYK